MSTSNTAVGKTAAQRWRGARWAVLALIVVAAVATVTTYLTAPRPGGRMDPESTSPDGAHALVSLLRDQGVDVTTADDIGEVEAAMRPDSLLVLAQTFYLDDDRLDRLKDLPGDRLLIEPVVRAREALAPEIRTDGAATFGGEPGCDVRAATRAGDVMFGIADTYAATGDVDLTRCYDGVLVRYTQDGRTITVVGSGDFLTNSGLPERGNAALAMNLTGDRPHVVWYAAELAESGTGGEATIYDLVPEHVSWIVWQLCLAVVLLALWQGRRLGPLVSERLPVVVRASETVEGRGRLYRSRRARDRAAGALRTAALQRLTTRLGLGRNPEPHAVAQSVAARCGRDAASVGQALFGPPPSTDSELVHLAEELDHIERQVAQS